MTQAPLFQQRQHQPRDPRLSERVPVAEMLRDVDTYARLMRIGPYATRQMLADPERDGEAADGELETE